MFVGVAGNDASGAYIVIVARLPDVEAFLNTAADPDGAVTVIV